MFVRVIVTEYTRPWTGRPKDEDGEVGGDIMRNERDGGEGMWPGGGKDKR